MQRSSILRATGAKVFATTMVLSLLLGAPSAATAPGDDPLTLRPDERWVFVNTVTPLSDLFRVRDSSGWLSPGDINSWNTMGSCNGASWMEDKDKFRAKEAPASCVVQANAHGDKGQATVHVIERTLRISPSDITIDRSTTQQFRVGSGPWSDMDLFPAPAWTQDCGGSISPDGLFTAPATGASCTITVSSGGVSASTRVTVRAPTLHSIRLTPSASDVAAGTPVSLGVVGLASDGTTVVPFTPHWTVPAGCGVAPTTTPYVVTPTVAGACVIAVSNGALIAATATLLVRPAALHAIDVASAGPTTVTVGTSGLAFSAAGRDAYQNAVTIAPQWTSDCGVIGSASGILDARASPPGTCTVTATAHGVSGSVGLTLVAGSPHQVVVSPASATLAAGATRAVSAIVQDAHGNPLAQSVSWDAPTCGSFAEGIYTAPTVLGDTLACALTARSDGASPGTATFALTPAALSRIDVAGPATLVANTSADYTFAGFDAFGNPVPLAVGTRAFLAPTTAGPASVCQTQAGVTGCANVTVVADVLHRLAVEGPASLVANTTGDFTVAGFDRYGNPVDVPFTTFTHTAPTLAGTSEVCTSVGDVARCVALVVLPDALARLELDGPASPTAGSSVVYTATGYDRYNNSVVLSRTQVSFDVPTVSGPSSVCATIDGATRCIDVLVVADGLHRIVVSGPAALVAATEADFTVSGFDRHNNSVTPSQTSFRYTAPTLAGDAKACIVVDGHTDCVDVVVLPDALDTLSVTGPASLVANTSARYAVRGADVHNNTVATAPAFVDYTAPTLAGPAQVCATVDGLTACASVDVLPDALHSIALLPPSALVAGELATFLVAGADRYGNPVAPPAASVPMLLPNGSGMHDACAELGGFSACVRVTVLPAELETITVSGPASMVANTTATFARVGADRFGNPIALTPSSFAFTAPTFAAPRDVCTSEGNVSGCLRVSVTPDALASLYLHGPASLVAGTNVTYEVRGFDRYENRVPVSTPTFTYEVPTGAGPARACVEVDALSTCRDVTVVADALTVVLVSGPSQLVANATASYDASGRDRFGNVVSTATFTFRAPTRAGDAQACTLLGGIEGCRTVSIVPDVVASVVVTGPSIVPAGATARFAVAASDAHGNAVDVGLVAFDQAAPTLAGPATACFTAGSVTGCAAYEVVAGALARLSLAAPARMVVGASAAPTAAGFDAHNNSVPVAPAWSASCGSFAGSAYVAPTSVGSCVLTATDRGVSASATVSILAGALQTLRIANGDIDRSADDRTPIVLSIAARDVHGNPIDVPASSLVWHGADVVNGVLQPIEAAGTRTLTARDPATNVSASINVTTRAGGLARIELSPPSVKVVENRSATFTTAYFDAQGNRLPTPAVFWQLDPIGVASFDARTATATGVSRGIATLTVRDLAGRVSANATIEVVSAAEAVVQATIIVPPPREGRNGLSAGEPFVFRVEAFDAAGVPIEGLVVTYTVEDPEIGTISADGVFTGNRVGTTGITARVGSVVARAVVTVVPGEPAMLRISPDSASRTLGGSIQLSAIGMDARRNVIPDLPITWSVNDSTMGSITPEGLYTAGAAVGASLVRASTVTTSGIVVYREAAIYQFISETRAPAGVDTVLAAVNLEAAVADVVTTTHVVGLAEVAPGALLDLSLPQSGPGTSALGTARVEIERAATDVTVMIEVQPASQFVLPEEVDRAMHETRIGDGRDQAPALYITVTATEDGRRLDSTQLNSLLRRLDITFHVEASYFTANNLDPNEVRLIEWSDGVLINANVPARLLTPEPVGGYYTYAATLMEFSSFAFVAKPLAAPAATTPAAPLPPTSAPAAPPLARILIAGPRTVVAGTTATYVLTGVAVDGTARTLAQGLLVSTFTQAGDAVLQYGEQGVVGAIRVTVLPGAAQTAVAENGTRVFAGSKGGIRLIGTDEFGNRVDLGWHAVEFTRAGTHTMTLVKDGLTVDATVEIVPNFLHEIRILGPDTLVAGTEATFTLAGFDAHGNPVALGESTLHVQAPNLMGPVEVFYEEGAVRGSKIVQVLAGKLARIEVRGVEVLRENATELYSLVGYDAGGNVVPLSRDVLEFVAPAGSHTTYVCFAEADVTGCLTVLVEREIEVHGDRGDGDGKAPFGVIGFALTLLGLVLCVVGLASILGVWRRRRSDEQEK